MTGDGKPQGAPHGARALEEEPTDEEMLDDERLGGPDSAQMRALLGGLAKEPAPSKDLVAAAQTRIRVRSRGKFYGDGWSTRETLTSPLVIALAMLVLVGLAYVILGPTSVSP